MLHAAPAASPIAQGRERWGDVGLEIGLHRFCIFHFDSISTGFLDIGIDSLPAIRNKPSAMEAIMAPRDTDFLSF